MHLTGRTCVGSRHDGYGVGRTDPERPDQSGEDAHPDLLRRGARRVAPAFPRVQAVCDRIGSTGLYPYAIHPDPDLVAARQFPQSSGYPEDAATGIAAAALAFGLLARGHLSPLLQLRVRQGRAMGHPSEITVRPDHDDVTITGCWIGGAVMEDVAR